MKFKTAEITHFFRKHENSEFLIKIKDGNVIFNLKNFKM